jgi:MoaA/NifB/PqqE/SkfB family radical SAM enzyme
MQLGAFIHSLSHSSIVLKRPAVIPRIVQGLYAGGILKKDRLRIVEFVVNHECNSRCVMCYATKYEIAGSNPLSPAEYRRIWKQCVDLGAFLAVIEGGEPILRKDLFEVIDALDPWNNIIVLVSNSIGLNAENLARLKKAGIAVLHLSLDGADAQTNDRIRGYPGHFNKVMEVVREAKRLGFHVYFSSVLKHTNAQEYIRIIELARSLGVGISGALIVTMGRYSGNFDERLTEEDRLWLLEVLKKYRSTIRFDWNNNFSGIYECPGGREKFSISLYGDIMTCVCNHLSFGNVREEPVKRIWERMRNFSLFRERNDKCLASFDTKYLREYLDPLADSKVLPVSIFTHPTKPAKLIDGKMNEG